MAIANRHSLGWKELQPSSTKRRGWPTSLIVSVLAVTGAWLYLLWWALRLLIQAL
jgi:hypothetical protein